jgi:uncharacterized protein (DUF342 family)
MEQSTGKIGGKLPQAKAGDVLAEIIPGVDGSNGTDVFGNEIVPPAVKSKLTKCGKGIVMSEDGTQYLAKLSGMISLSDDNKISIVETLAIEGDIGLETGHIAFDGHVEVTGSVHKGYRVSCKSLRAEDIQEAEITVAGDMVVMGGIYDSTIKCRGKLQASHIRKSTIQAGDDLVVEKEIMESKIESSGKCLIAEGTIIYSEITAKNGIVAHTIGTKGSKPSALLIGIDKRRNRQIKYGKNKLELQKKELTKLPAEIEKLQNDLDTLEKEAGVLSTKLSKHTDTIRVKNTRLKKLDGKARKYEAQGIRKAIETLNSEKGRIEKQRKTVKDTIGKLSERMTQKEKDLHDGRRDMNILTAELDSLVADRTIDQDGAMVQVNGIVYSGTTVTGPHATLTTSQDVSRLAIKEVKKMDEDGTASWGMQMAAMT